MKRTFSCLSQALLSLSLLAVSSCSKLCDEGYEGKRCDVEIRDKFEGNWNAVDEPGTKTYPVAISEGTAILDVLISRSFSDSVFIKTVRASISGDSIIISEQKPDTSKIYVSGAGVLESSRNKINWNYNLINRYDTVDAVTSYTGVWAR